jgi:hypothetical protein
MTREQLTALLEQVRDGQTTPADAADRLRFQPFEDLGFARLDLHRDLRCGFPEVIFGEGKSAEQIALLLERSASYGRGCLATRVDAEKAAFILARLPQVEHEPVGRTLWMPPARTEPERAETESASPANSSLGEPGRVVVVTAGTGDLPVAREAETTARVMGARVDFLVDVGVAGLHRLLESRDRLLHADAVVVVAGMEGALPSVVGGLVDCPVIAVPTSVGYGANFQGVSALLCMLTSCAANVTVVNIDAGFCGGYVAALIARRVRRPG